LDEDRTGIIAEFKRRSPSKGIINDSADVFEVTSAYADYGASALSILTDEYFFGGYNEDILKARINQIPILRKDFTIDAYQVKEQEPLAQTRIINCGLPETGGSEAAGIIRKGIEFGSLLEIHNHEELDHIAMK